MSYEPKFPTPAAQNSSKSNKGDTAVGVLGIGTIVMIVCQFIPMPFGLDKPLDRFEEQVNERVLTPERKASLKEMFRKNLPELTGRLEKNDTRLKVALEDLDSHVANVRKSSVSFSAVDIALETAKFVNSLIISDLADAISAWETNVSSSLSDYRVNLEFAIPLFKERAAEMYEKAKNSAEAPIGESYLVQARHCEAMAVHAEKRFAVLFGSGSSDNMGIEEVTRRRVDIFKKMSALHKDWKITLDSWPSTFGDDGLQAYVKKLNDYVADLKRFDTAMSRLRDALDESAPAAPAEPPANPRPDPAPQPERPVVPVRTVSVRKATQPRPQPRQVAEVARSQATEPEPKPVRPSQPVAAPEPAPVMPRQPVANPQPIRPSYQAEAPEAVLPAPPVRQFAQDTRQPVYVTREVVYVEINGQLVPQVVTVRHYDR